MSPSPSIVAAVLESRFCLDLETERSRFVNWSDWTATKIGNALFPGWPLRISHLVTLRPSKAPITVCESALRRCLPPGKRFFFPLQAPATVASVRISLGSEMSFLRHARLGNKWSPFSFGEVLSSPNGETVLFRRLRSSYPLASCSPAEPASVSLDNKTLAHLGLRSMASSFAKPIT